jgi:hypothetical protein
MRKVLQIHKDTEKNLVAACLTISIGILTKLLAAADTLALQQELINF